MAATLSLVDAAYLAGLLDGEGHIGTSVRGPTMTVAAKLEVCMTTFNVLRWCLEVTEVGILRPGHEARPGRRQPWHWQVADVAEAADVIRQVEPFLKVKRGQAKAFLVLANLRLCKVRGRRQFPLAELALHRIITGLKQS